jgi:cell division septation protein DedD
MDKALKQRLVGASILIILAVIILPMLLSGRSETLKQESRQIELPPKPEELSIETRRFPVGSPDKSAANNTPPAVEPANNPEPELQQSVDTDVSTVGTQVPEPAVQPQTTDAGIDGQDGTQNTAADDVLKSPAVTSITLKSAPDKNLDVSQATDGSQDTPRYLVQVASFSSEKNANALAGQLRADSMPVLMDVVDRPTGRLHRVRLGPYSERSEADTVVASLSSKMTELTPRILDLRPSESAPVSTPSDPLVRWVVQVGSFNSSQKAETLVAELRLSGLSAFSEKVSTADSTVFKVRIGPELDRDKAAELAREVKSDHGLDGFVTTQE